MPGVRQAKFTAELFHGSGSATPRLGEVDFLIDGRLILEFDGAAFHMDRKSFRRDLRRNNAGVVRSYATLRFTYEDVFGNPTGMMRDIREALRRRPRGIPGTAAGTGHQPRSPF
jgi:hypothetical protein